MSDYQTVPYDIIGGNYAHRSRALSSQTLKMMYPEIVPSGKTPTALLSFPGLTLKYTGTSGKDRGCHEMNGKIYKIEGTTLYELDSNYTATSKGTIAGSNYCIMEDDGVNLIISTGATRYQYVQQTGVLSEFSDVSHEPGNSAAFLNNQMIYDGTNQDFLVANVGAPSTFNALNVGTAESNPDDCTRVFVKDTVLYLIGPKSIEPWWNSGSGNPPFSRINQSIRSVGAASPYAVTDSKTYLYFLSDDGQMYRFSQFREFSVTPTAISKTFSTYTLTDAKLTAINIESMYMIIVEFPTSAKTWMYLENTETWTELTSTNLETRHPIGSYVKAFNTHLICDYSNGNLYELDFDAFTNNGDVIIRERIGKPFDSMQVTKQPGQKLVMRRMRLVCETAVGTGGADQGTDPVLLMSLSFDGGKSYTNERSVPLGRNSDGLLEAVYDHKAAFYNVTPRIRMSDPNRLTIMAASFDIKGAGVKSGRTR